MRRTKKWRLFVWKQALGLPECPYVYRWVLDLWFFSVRVHHFLRSDDDRALHDHPWWFVTWVLAGNYVDHNEAGDELLMAGDVRFRPAHHKHTVHTKGVWTLVLTGKERNIWGFYPGGLFKRHEKYFAKYGHHLCE